MSRLTTSNNDPCRNCPTSGVKAIGQRSRASPSGYLNRELRDHGLTQREYEILRHVAKGDSNPEIASELGLARNTVKTYLQHTMEKLGAHNRVETIGRASELGNL